ncbi:MAG: hypothetical protein JKY54_01600 [Flavobacteriales bacterium]|nr:hypothetical protein [Flavobacteriales bacterium]
MKKRYQVEKPLEISVTHKVAFMKSKIIIYITACFLVLLPAMMVPPQAYAQKEKKTVSIKKQNKKNMDTKGTEEDKKKQMKEVTKEVTKRHMKLQDKATKKRMKQTKKKSERLKANKKEPFFKRWFRKR